MPPRHVIFTPEHYYHIYNRGVNHQTIFFSRVDRLEGRKSCESRIHHAQFYFKK